MTQCSRVPYSVIPCRWVLSEFALAHVEAKTVAAYGRVSLVEKRRPVIQAWRDHATGARGN